jgi:hypothetical protein
MAQAFWMLNYLTVWESFYYERENGVMEDQTWEAYVCTLRMLFHAPKMRRFWETLRGHGTYRPDWTNFMNRICGGEKVVDPAPSRRRFLRLR